VEQLSPDERERSAAFSRCCWATTLPGRAIARSWNRAPYGGQADAGVCFYQDLAGAADSLRCGRDNKLADAIARHVQPLATSKALFIHRNTLDRLNEEIFTAIWEISTKGCCCVWELDDRDAVVPAGR
jgi:hypothetical protein